VATNELTPEDLAAITEIDRLVHQPARLSILALLYVVESAGFLYVRRQTGLTQGNLSSHVSKLESAGYVEINKEFVDKTPRTLLRLTPRGREAFQVYRQQLQQVLDGLPE
jgi:DNA-binding MarR family transcriptional regulator